MTNSLYDRVVRKDPPPPNPRAVNPYTRFIPREEIQAVRSWRLGGFDEPGASAAATPPSPPSEPEWTERVQAARRDGAKEGYQTGYRDGLAALESFKENLARQTTAQVQALLERLEAEFDALQPRVAEVVAQVAADLARQVLRAELHQQPQTIAAVATQAIQAVVLSARHVTVRLHPEDLPLVQQGSADVVTARHARLLPDPTLSRGDCVVESDVGVVDARVATRWAQATAHLTATVPWQDERPVEAGE